MKVTDLFINNSGLVITFDEGESMGQIRWRGEIVGNGFGVFPFSAEQINSVTREEMWLHYEDIEPIRKLDANEYPALVQAINEFRKRNPAYQIEF